jgi:recombinational DNA repair protein (RecF pathway)
MAIRDLIDKMYTMQQKVEGIILSKTPYQDRHLICSLLLRSGRKISVMFYGGQSGGKKAKVTGLELGHLVEVAFSYSRGNELYRANSWLVKWQHGKIRYNYHAFSLMCFYLELASHMAQVDDLHDDLGDVDIGIFRAISNALFHLETAVEQEKFNLGSELILFFCKILFEQGIFPQLDYCCFSEQSLAELEEIVLVPDHGGFAVPSMVHHEQMDGKTGKNLWNTLMVVKDTPYQKLWELETDRAMINQLWNYFCYQMHWKRDEFKTFSAMF